MMKEEEMRAAPRTPEKSITPDEKKGNPVHPPTRDPAVPNRAHTEMRTEFPPEFPYAPKQEF